MCGETASNVTNSRSEKENLPPVFISVKATAHDSHHSLVFCVESSALAASQHIHPSVGGQFSLCTNRKMERVDGEAPSSLDERWIHQAALSLCTLLRQ